MKTLGQIAYDSFMIASGYHFAEENSWRYLDDSDKRIWESTGRLMHEAFLTSMGFTEPPAPKPTNVRHIEQ